jgi:predicted NBD/HSP70 family sugar kinase
VPSARAILEKAAEPLGRSLATLLLVLDIQSIYLVGRFGPHGSVWIESLQKEIRRNVDPGLSFSLHYRPLDDDGYLLGAASLVAGDYLDYSVLATSDRDTAEVATAAMGTAEIAVRSE